MKGHVEIIKMRLRRQKPSLVFINDYPCDEQLNWHKYGDHATVCVHGDPIESLDFRFLVGTRVSITSMDEGRTKRLFERVKSAGAEEVVAGHAIPGGALFVKTGWTEIWHKGEGDGRNT